MKHEKDKKFDFKVRLIPDEQKYVITCTVKNKIYYLTAIHDYTSGISPNGDSIDYIYKGRWRKSNWILFLKNARRFSGPKNAIAHIHKVLYPYHYPTDENKFLDVVWEEDGGYHPNEPDKEPPEELLDDPFYYRLISAMANAKNSKQDELEEALSFVVDWHMDATGMYKEIENGEETTK